MYEYKGVVERVIDGDTLLVNVDLGFDIWKKERFRLARIDAPELTGEERTMGLFVKQVVTDIFNRNNRVLINSTGKDNYGRYIAEITVDDVAGAWNLSTWLLEMGYAQPYVK